MTQFSTRRLTMNAALIAIYIVLEYFSVYIGNYIKLSFYAFPMLVAAMLFGTVDGLFVAGIGEFLYQMLHYGFSATTLLWIVPPMVHALIAGVMTQKMRDSLSMGKVGLTVIVSGIVSTILTTFVVQLDAKIYHYEGLSGILILFRFVNCAIMCVIYTLVLPQTILLLKHATTK